MGRGSYNPGEGRHIKLRFKHGAGIEKIWATFVCEKDEDATIILSGITNKQGGDEWLTILSGRAPNKPGVYISTSLEAEYGGGFKVPFRTPLPDAVLQVRDPPLQRPTLVDGWEWAGD